MIHHKPVSRPLEISLGQYSDAGRKPENQDFHGALIPDGNVRALKGITLAVADGISSSAVSGAASETAVKALMTDYYSTPDAWTVQTAATRVIWATNAWLHGQNQSVSDINAGQVCTLSALILKGNEGHILHAGDSRVSRLSGRSLEPLTTDHRTVLSSTESYLARGMGISQRIELDYEKVILRVGDVFLLTTDGVHEFIDSVVVSQALDGSDDLDVVAKQIAQIALERGSDDNLTIQIVRIDALPEGEALPDIATLPLPSLPNAGDQLDGYTILRSLHASARSHVYLAQDARGQKVALKIPAGETAQDETYLKRFVLEEWIARRIRSAHVLQVPEQGKRSRLYVLSEFVDGITLRQWIADHPKPDLDEVRDIIDQLSKGLRALHRREMIHQDIRPENVMIDRNGTVKIIDLGSVSVAGVEEAAPGLLGHMPGTYQYTAPEYLANDVVSWRSDQYALGVIAYEMLTGRLPYGAQVARIRSSQDQMRLRYDPARDEESGVPRWMDAALARAVHPDPLRRYDALTEFVADLCRPGASYREGQHVPLMQRNPLRFWQGLSAVLAILCLVQFALLMG
ncbi:protein kinase [Donghicola sp. C2-DW-16]|uniref:Protein kinase n=1 Tax=Donghicola mangrovi TaxID=2729614 RepID=A0ABX2PGN2_9RHOB|nr:bifunctional protein-serine/threonine kinase/phosphatase [Donghicola mangrovi]NVO28645.1 protein kinase [Donghicola mangrovi]